MSRRFAAAGAIEAWARTTTLGPGTAPRTASWTAARYAAILPCSKCRHAPSASAHSIVTGRFSRRAESRMSSTVGARVLSRAATTSTAGPIRTASSAMARSIRMAAKLPSLGVASAAAPTVEQVHAMTVAPDAAAAKTAAWTLWTVSGSSCPLSRASRRSSSSTTCVATVPGRKRSSKVVNVATCTGDVCRKAIDGGMMSTRIQTPNYLHGWPAAGSPTLDEGVRSHSRARRTARQRLGFQSHRRYVGLGHAACQP